MYKDFRDRYLRIANSSALLNEKMNRGMFLSITGAAVHKRGISVRVINRLDPRISTLLVQPSRSGKGAALKIAQNYAEALRLSYTQEVQITDAALVGKIDLKAHQRNKDKGYEFDDPNFVDPLILGDLGLFDVIAFPEAKMMFKVGPHTEDKLEILQMALDTPGLVRKKLADDVPIEYPTDSTIIGTTYFLDEFEEVLLKQGMFQRLLLFVEPFGEKKRSELNKSLIRPPEDILKEEEFKPELQKLAIDVNKQINKFERGTIITKDESGMRTFEKLDDQRMKEVSASFRGKDLEIMLPYTTAIINMHHKLACIAAVLNGSETIGRKEVTETQPEIQTYFNCVVNDIITRVSGVNPEKLRKIIITKISKEPKGLSVKELKKDIDQVYHISQRQVGHVIRDMTKNKEINKSKKGIVTLNR